MSFLEPASTVIDADAPPDLVEVGCYLTAQAGFDHGLVVLAVGYPYWLTPTPAGHRLFVEAGAVGRVREHLAKFDRESAGWPPPPISIGYVPGHPTDVITPLLWVAILLAVFRGQASHPEWLARGSLDAAGIFDRGEAWRAVTALFLHADGAHLISNVAMGFLLFIAVLKTFGRQLGWLLVGGAAMLGNLAVAAANYPGPYRSLGASTALFSGLGLLTGRALQLVSRSAHPHRARGVLVAVGAGLTMFALYGAGGARVDLGAHLAGFAAGLALGFVAGRNDV